MADRPSRRGVLRSGIALGAVSLAGCLSLDGGGGDSNGNDTETDPSDDTTDPNGNGTDDGNTTDPDDPEPEPTIDRWPQFQYDAGNTGYVDAEGPTADVEEVWNDQLDPQVAASPLLAEETLYVTDLSGTVHAFATADGDKQWSEPLGETADRTGAIYEDLLVVPTHDAIYGLDLATGDERWREPNEGKATHLTLVDGIVAFANRSTTVRALDAATGEEQWRWDDAEDTIDHALAYDGEALYGHDWYNSVYRFQVEEGRPWVYASIPDVFRSMPTIRDGTFVVAGPDGDAFVYDMEPQQLSKRWTYPTDNGIASNCCITDEYVAFNDAGMLTVVTLDTGEELWRYDSEVWPSMIPVLNDGMFYISSSFGAVETRSLSTGELAWNPEVYDGEFPDPLSPQFITPVFEDGTIYAVGETGVIRAFVEPSSSHQ